MSTTEDIAKLRAEKSSDFDALVWLRLHAATCARCDEPATTITDALPFCGPDCAERISDFASEDAEDARPRYSEDPAADYATLKLVRETWDDAAKRLWLNRLYELQTHDLSRWPQPGCDLVYLPGDYSHAALLALAALADAGAAKH